MLEKLKKYWMVVAVLVTVIIALVALMISSRNIDQTQNQQATPTTVTRETSIPTPTAPPAAGSGFGPNPSGSADQINRQNQELEQNQKDYPLAGILPYQTALFTVDHYRAPLQLVVIIKKESNKNLVTEMINNWLVENGLKANSHQIIWTTSD